MYTMYMALHITNRVVEKQVRDLATERGESITDVIGIAVRQLRLTSEHETKAKPTVDEMLALIRSFPVGAVNYNQTEEEILGYGPHGYPES